ncbi:hypothetical protein [Candidatus Phytoplasma bonamiae]|uniref:Uncharacterized protein n=1 Tax=Candidatus Phytoplasma bonamiae TaxID=2982626 RepID=A0ABT9D4S9_9MOLU|nr:hypothetical protein ['Bonamia sp.' little leaf phytoplasma]MDO8064017.1 hypothetical protein ['Bonamia sp.' little leaf phytoplasma]MDV3174486.1 hypothetical protein ['Bonamia sp.' little leaf phytoplasma]
MYEIKKITFNKIILNIFITILFLLSSLACFEPKYFSIKGIRISDILLGILLLLFNYYFVFLNFKKNSGLKKFFFLIETFFLLTVSFSLFMSFLITNSFVQKMLTLSNIISYILIIHSFISLHLFGWQNDKINIWSLNGYLVTFGTSCFLLGKNIDFSYIILRIFSIFFGFLFLFYLFIVIKQISNYNKKNIK